MALAPLATLSGGSGGIDLGEASADSDTITGPITLGGDFITGGGSGGPSMTTIIVVGVVVVAVAFFATR